MTSQSLTVTTLTLLREFLKSLKALSQSTQDKRSELSQKKRPRLHFSTSGASDVKRDNYSTSGDVTKLPAQDLADRGHRQRFTQHDLFRNLVAREVLFAEVFEFFDSEPRLARYHKQLHRFA